MEEVAEEVDYLNDVGVLKTGRALQNSAGDLFDPSVMRSISNPVLTVERNVQSFSPASAIRWTNAVNRVDWTLQADPLIVVAKQLAKITTIEATSRVYRTEDQADVWYWRIRVEVQFMKDGWQPKLVDQGFAEWIAHLGERRHMLDLGSDNPVDVPQFLDGNGKRAARGADGKVPAANIKYRPDPDEDGGGHDSVYHIYYEDDFNECELL